MPQLDPLELIARVQGEREIASLEEKVGKLTATLVVLDQRLQAGSISQQRFAQGSVAVASQVSDLRARIDNLKDALPKVADETEKADTSLKKMAFSLNRLEHGTRGAIHGLEQILETLGAGPGLAGGIALVAEGAHLVYQHWDDLVELVTDERPEHALLSWKETIAGIAREVQESLDQFNAVYSVLADIDRRTGVGTVLPWLSSKLERQAGEDYERERNEKEKQRLEHMGESALHEPSPEEKRNKKIFDIALSEYTGEQLVQDFIAQENHRVLHERDRPLNPAEIEQTRKKALVQIGYGKEGKYAPEDVGDIFSAAFETQMKGVQIEEDEKDEAKRKKKEDLEQRKKDREEKRALDEEAEANKKLYEYRLRLRKEEFEGVKQKESHGLQDKIKDLRRESEDIGYAVHHMGKSHTMSARAYATKITEGGFDNIANQQLAVQHKIHLAIRKLEDKLTDVNRMKFRQRGD